MTVREVASLLPFSILRYLARAASDEDAERVRVASGEARTMAELLQRGSWSSLASTLAIASEAARLTGDTQIGRRGGEELFRFTDEIGVADLYRAEPSISNALDAVIAVSSRVSVGKVMTVLERSSNSTLVEGHYTGGTTPTTLFCDYSAGYWAAVPSLFGAAGYAAELECEARGDDRCLTRVSWVSPDEPAADNVSAGARNSETFLRYEELQQMAADLIAAEDVSAVLDLVVQRAGHAVLAPTFLLAVQLPGETEPRVHHLGFRDDASARRAADLVLVGHSSPSTLVVQVASRRHHYGSIAAIYPHGTSGSDSNRRLLSAYATHVAAALEAAAAFEAAQRDRDTAQALLHLSRGLAGVVTVAETAKRLSNAVPAITGGRRGSIFLWDPTSRLLRLAACDDASDAANLPSTVVIDDIDGGAGFLDAGTPALLDVDVANGPLLHLMRSIGAQHSAAAPIVARGDVLGLVVASFDRRLPASEQRLVLERLSGFADLAATAFDNARLLEHSHHQARHDDLTGLPNRPMLEDRASQALARGRRTDALIGLMFVDVDRLKGVNDTLGHQAGDDLIRLVAHRLRGELREVDTLARIGGDEFVVLLEDLADGDSAISVAERLTRSFAEPFLVAGHRLEVSCSVGLAIEPASSTDYETLLHQADAAMYVAKAAGGNSFVVHVPEPARACTPSSSASV